MILPSTTANGNPFDPVTAQMWFYYNILPGDFAPQDLLSANNTVRTALFYEYQNVSQVMGIGNDPFLANPGFLAQSFSGQWPSTMRMTEGMQYPSGAPPSFASVINFQTACNGYLYQLNNTMMRVVQVCLLMTLYQMGMTIHHDDADNNAVLISLFMTLRNSLGKGCSQQTSPECTVHSPTPCQPAACSRTSPSAAPPTSTMCSCWQAWSRTVRH